MVGVRSPESGQSLPEETHTVASLVPSSPSLLGPGDHIGSYRLLELLGDGATGRVFSAEHTIRGKAVAIKVIRPELSLGEDTVFACFAEARRVSALGLPGTAHVHDLVVGNELFPTFSVMERLQGQSLAAFMQSSPSISLDTVYRIGMTLAQTLDTVHQQGITHCRLHPGNVFVGTSEGPEPSVKILDFGISKLSRGYRQSIFAPYFAPEQVEDSQPNELSDIFGLGAILRSLVEARDVSPGKPVETPQGLLDLIERCTNPVALRRPRTAAEISEELASLFSRHRSARRRTRILQSGLLLLVMSLALWGWHAMSRSPSIQVEPLPVPADAPSMPAPSAKRPEPSAEDVVAPVPQPAPPQEVVPAPDPEPTAATPAESVTLPAPNPEEPRQSPQAVHKHKESTSPKVAAESGASSLLPPTPEPPVQPSTPESIDRLIVKDPFTEGPE
jgi:eukaryotic-like serine/threonine-protein kinase